MATARGSIKRWSAQIITMKDLISFLLDFMFGDKGKRINVHIKDQDEEQLITLAAPEDILGQLIGRNGQTVRALKILLSLQNRGQRNFRLEIQKLPLSASE